MYKSKDFTLLRNWTLGRDNEIGTEDLKKAFADMIDAVDCKMWIQDITIDDNLSGIALQDSTTSNYMGIYVYRYYTDGECFVEMSAEGKGEQVKAPELEGFFQKASGMLGGMYHGFQYSKNVMRRFGVGGTAGAIGGSLAYATGAVIGGSIRLAAKGMKALLRDKEAYEKEMAFYKQTLALGDYLIGGTDSANFTGTLELNANKDKVTAQYLLASAYNEGRAVNTDLSRAVKWYDKAAENGEERSRSILAYEYLFGETVYGMTERQKGLVYLTELAEADDMNAVEALLSIYWNGDVADIPTDYVKAVVLAEKHLDTNNSFVLSVLAQAYDSANGAEISALEQFHNDEKAAAIYARLVELGDKEQIGFAAKRLVSMFFAGKGGEVPKSKIKNYLTYASAAGDLGAKIYLTECCVLGLHMEKDLKKAKSLCDELLKLNTDAAIAASYYYNYKIADEEEMYKMSLEYAQKYIDCAGGLDEKKTEAKDYIDQINAKVSMMSEDEQRTFFKEKKPIFSFFKKKK